MTSLHSLHGPERPEWVTDTYGAAGLFGRRTRLRLVSPLSFNWRQEAGEWHQDWSAYRPMTFPAPIPDYSPDELAKIEAAEMKRARKKGA